MLPQISSFTRMPVWTDYIVCLEIVYLKGTNDMDQEVKNLITALIVVYIRY